MRHTQTSRVRTGILGLAALVGLISCRAADLNIVNPNNATVAGAIADPTSFQLLSTGLLVDLRGTRSGMITFMGAVGRESYTFTPTEGRNTTGPIIGITVAGVQKLDPAGFGVAPWSGQYAVLRDIFNYKKTITAHPTLTVAQKAASLGFAQTIEALMLFDIVQTHDSLGSVVEIKDDPTALSPFVSRDSTYKYILNTLDAASTNLVAGGTAFPFTFNTGFAGFNTPTTFNTFVKAMKGKVAAHYATSGGGATQWAVALTALNASFLNAAATTRTALDVGVYDTYGAAPDTPNGLTQATNSNLYAHMSYVTDAQSKGDGTKDNRYLAKIRTGIAVRTGPLSSGLPTSGSSTIGFSIWPTATSSIAIIRNEELILLRAEAKLGSGDKAGAIADLNIVRINSGGLPASTLTAASPDADVITGILYEKRFSTMMEATRWVDLRRYGRLDDPTLLDIPSGVNKNFVAKVSPVPQAECLVRVGQTGDLLGPKFGAAQLNDCAP
jgi:starch-binding outer membrane protein, SusD/RagB family